jgi:hypothetical protein
MAEKTRKVSKKWMGQTRGLFRDFLDKSDFPDPERTGKRGPKFRYPEWLIMFIVVLSVKMNLR